MSRARLEVLRGMKRALIGDKAKVQINVDIFLNDPRTLPEHTNYYEDLDKLVAELAEVNDKIVEVDRMLEDCKNGN
tara:strand:- start:1134 stop:1361 length:228 start_codon:yes stop_codon:yes gene_type:complete